MKPARPDEPVAVAGAPSIRARLAVAVVVAILGAFVASIKFAERGYPVDFSYWWVAARAVVAGQDPYSVLQRGGPFHFDNIFVYPLPAAVAAVPLAWLDVNVAGMIFSGVGLGCLAFAITRDDWHRWPILMSGPALWCVSSGQWSTYVTAAALMPAFAWAAACKPTLGLAGFLYRPSWRFLMVGGAFALVAFAVMPDWPWRWIAATQRSLSGNYHVPLAVPGGAFLALAALRWRRPEARLLLGMSCIPQTMFPYDHLALGLVPATRAQAYAFALWTHVIIWIARFVAIGPRPPDLSKVSTLNYLSHVVTWAIYLPLLVVVLRRPNVGAVPPAVERWVVGWPHWLRGRAAAATVSS